MVLSGSKRQVTSNFSQVSALRMDALHTGLEVIANRFGKKLDADSPIMNLRLPDGSRMAAMIPPVVNPKSDDDHSQVHFAELHDG